MAIATLSNLTFQPNLAYDADLNPTLKAIDVLATGQLQVMDIEGNTKSYAVAAVPYRLEMRILQIIGDGAGNVGTDPETDIALANLAGLH